jgi:3'-phosphoadenosine 5'-phosphosulfate sulfotransferase (PAPS reductase)/FAD synthetase
MLKKIIDAYNGKLPKDIVVCFANTGKEMEETLEFVHECEKRWNIKIHWLELDIATTSPIWRSKEVCFKTASRNGEPFEKLITKKGKLPSLYQRTCTIELKINTINRFMRNLGYKEWYSALGLRYDEPRRVSDSKKNSQKHINIAPLYEAKVTNEDILAYWKNSPFDLKLPSINGKTVAGNCDLCFLKGTQTTLNLLKEKPHLADWWSNMETKHKSKFRTNRPDYIKLVDLSQKNFETELDDTHFSCFCHD